MVSAGDVLGDRYRIVEQVASGGMGTVFRAEDERLGRTVAIKILRHDLARDDRFVERFRREARSAAALSDPNIATVYDYGEDAGTHFIVMDFVDGRDLARVIREEAPLSEARSAYLGAQVCKALAHAHDKGVVHRDIKPGNIMVAHGDHVKVTDFGIARAAGESTLTATGSVLGTAQYLSPEQANGEPATGASDIYALGVVLYEMLTGSVPFTGDSAVAVAMRHLNDDMPLPSSLNTSVGARMDSIVVRATQKRPAARYASAADMAIDLEARDTVPATAVMPVAAEDPARTTAPLAVARSPAVRRAMVWAGGLLLLLAFVATALALTRTDERDAGDRSPRRDRARAVAETQPAPTTAAPALVVPNVIGWAKPDAEHALKELGLKPHVSEEGEQAPFEPKDIVYAMSPEPDTPVSVGDTITLFIGIGEDAEDDDEDEGPPEGGPPGQLKKEDKEHDD